MSVPFENLTGDFADQIQAKAASVTEMPDIPPLAPPGPMPSVPTPPPGQGSGGGSDTPAAPTAPAPPTNWFCKTFPNSILCPGGITTPGGPTPGTPSGGSICSIPLIGSYACDLGARFFFIVLAIIAISIGLWALVGGGVNIVLPEAREFSAVKGFVKGTVPFAGGRKEAA